MDAGAFGARLTPEDAFRFASGEEVTASNGMRIKLARPLDFIVVADHSDNMGFFPKLFAGDPAFLADPTGKRWYELIQKGGQEAVSVALEVIDRFSKGTFPPALASTPGTPTYRSAWEYTIKAAEAQLTGKGRLLVRKSGTEPLVRIMAEGDDEALVRKTVADVKSAVVAAAKAA